MTDKLKKILVSLEGLSHEELIKAIEGTLFLLIQDDEAKEKKIEEIKEIAEETKKMQGEPGKDGKTPTEEEIKSFIKHLIPDTIPGKDYVLTEQDKKEIAKKIEVPVVEKVIEKTEVIREQPIVTNEIKEVAKYENPEQIRDKLEELTGEDRLDKSAIKGLAEEIKKLSDRWEAGRPIFGPGKTKVYLKDLSASLDGATKTFFIGTHFGISGVFGSSSPFVFRPTIDYIESGKNIVFDASIDATLSLAGGQSLIVQYLK